MGESSLAISLLSDSLLPVAPFYKTMKTPRPTTNMTIQQQTIYRAFCDYSRETTGVYFHYRPLPVGQIYHRAMHDTILRRMREGAIFRDLKKVIDIAESSSKSSGVQLNQVVLKRFFRKSVFWKLVYDIKVGFNE